jgi:hypothetical protein
MWIGDEDIAALMRLEQFLEEEQGSIDATLILSGAGFGDAPFSRLTELYHGELEEWQRDEFAETLDELLCALEEAVREAYSEDWEPATVAKYDALIRAARALEARLERDEET